MIFDVVVLRTSRSRLMTMNLGIVGGTSINESEVFRSWERIEVETEFGRVELKTYGGIFLAHRHGFELNLAPHVSNYKGYVAALKQVGVDSALTVSSVGSLKEDLLPGTLVSCDDYVSFSPMTYVKTEMKGSVPEVKNGLIDSIAKMTRHPIERGRVYIQTLGPRFETPAEVRVLQMLGCDVVGMTFANEADLFSEVEISLNSLCMVDNFANGIEADSIALKSFFQGVRDNQSIWDELFVAIVEQYGVESD